MEVQIRQRQASSERTPSKEGHPRLRLPAAELGDVAVDEPTKEVEARPERSDDADAMGWAGQASPEKPGPEQPFVRSSAILSQPTQGPTTTTAAGTSSVVSAAMSAEKGAVAGGGFDQWAWPPTQST